MITSKVIETIADFQFTENRVYKDGVCLTKSELIKELSLAENVSYSYLTRFEVCGYCYLKNRFRKALKDCRLDCVDFDVFSNTTGII